MYAVMRFNKLKSRGQISARGAHNERTRPTPNADEERLARNERLAGSGNWLADVERRLADAPTIRTNAVLAYDFVFTASRAFFAEGDERERAARLDQWRDATMDWLRGHFGAANVVAAVLHRDELTPHIQAMVVPLDGHDHLNARAFTGGAAKVSALQDSYHAAVAGFGLERGVKGSVAAHQDVKDFYSKLDAATPTVEHVLEAVQIERPGRLVAHPERWAQEQEGRIVGELRAELDAALTKARHYEERTHVAEANVQVLQGRVRSLDTELGRLAAQVREADLPAVIEALGGERDRYDTHKWALAGEHISINGRVFYNHDRGEGGRSAIDLVKQATGYDFKQAVGYLSHTLGAEIAATAAVGHVAPRLSELAERAERPPFQPPQRDEGRWNAVRHYLTEGRRLPGEIVDALHRQGLVYADHRANAVFLRRDPDGAVTGASLRGTLSGSTFKGLAAGTRRDAGHFWYSVGEPRPYHAPQLVIAEAPIDAISLHALHYRDGGQATFVATDGAGALPLRMIDQAREQRSLIHCAFDRDQAGERLWATIRERYGEAGDIVRDRPTHGKDWNDALVRAAGAASAGLSRMRQGGAGSHAQDDGERRKREGHEHERHR